RGQRWLEDEHDDRLRRSLRELDFPEVDLDRLAERLDRTVAASGILEGTVHVQITRGVAPRAHAFPNPPLPPTELTLGREYDDTKSAEQRQTGIGVISHPDLRWKRCDVKSTNLLGNVLANEAAHHAGCYEAVLVDEAGLVTEATHSSVLWVRQGRLEGTPEGPRILPGTTRRRELRLARRVGVPFEEGRSSLEELRAADEGILLGTGIEVMPVVSIDGKPVGSGRPGPVTIRLQDAFRSDLESWLATRAV